MPEADRVSLSINIRGKQRDLNDQSFNWHHLFCEVFTLLNSSYITCHKNPCRIKPSTHFITFIHLLHIGSSNLIYNKVTSFLPVCFSWISISTRLKNFHLVIKHEDTNLGNYSGHWVDPESVFVSKSIYESTFEWTVREFSEREEEDSLQIPSSKCRHCHQQNITRDGQQSWYFQIWRRFWQQILQVSYLLILLIQ